MRSDGYARVDDILALPNSRKNKLTLELVREIVDGNDKKRFTLLFEDDEYLIRANQGHSDQVDLLLLMCSWLLFVFVI